MRLLAEGRVTMTELHTTLTIEDVMRANDILSWMDVDQRRRSDNA